MRLLTIATVLTLGCGVTVGRVTPEGCTGIGVSLGGVNACGVDGAAISEVAGEIAQSLIDALLQLGCGYLGRTCGVEVETDPASPP